MCYIKKMLNSLVAIDSDIFFKRSAVRNTRGNSMKLDKQHFIANRDGHFFVTVSLIPYVEFAL